MLRDSWPVWKRGVIGGRKDDLEDKTSVRPGHLLLRVFRHLV